MSEKEISQEELQATQKERLQLASINFTDAQLEKYFKMPDSLGEYKEGVSIPNGYKKCGKCGEILKLYLFNKNSANKLCATGNCKQCQKDAAKKSYKKTKKKRNYKRYYQENKEVKKEAAREYYRKNKDKLSEKHKAYRESEAGRKAMAKAHKKRNELKKANAGVPYNREMVIHRDGEFLGLEKPICWICGQSIEDTSGNFLHLDHVVSINNGGLDCFSNVACTHKECNLRKEKDDRTLDVKAVREIEDRTGMYMDAYPEKFLTAVESE